MDKAGLSLSSSTTQECVYTYAIIGGGIAGVSCVEQILECDPTSQVLLISSSSVVKEATNVTKLTKTLQDFILVERSLKEFKNVHQAVNVVNDKVEKVDGDKHTITTSSSQYKYKKLCICTGGRPNVVFPLSPHVLGIRDTESVQDLAKRISKARRVLLIGNGGIATEFVHEVEGVEIIWVMKDKSISAQFVDPGASEFFLQSKLGKDHQSQIQGVTKRMRYDLSQPDLESQNLKGSSEPGSALGPDWHANVPLQGLQDKKNIKIIYETECLKVISPSNSDNKEEDWPVFAHLTNGEVVGADLIVSATGVKPNCSWMKNVCQVDEDKGILVNCGMKTSVKDIFAAGDVCYPNWTWSKHWFQMRLWTQARHMGLYAGKSMYLSHSRDLEGLLGDETNENDLDFCFEIFSHVTKFFGFKVVLLGLFNAQGLDSSKLEYLVRCTKGVEYIKVILEGGRMQGAILIGDTGLEETFENLILNQVDLSSYGEDLLNPDIDIEDYFD